MIVKTRLILFEKDVEFGHPSVYDIIQYDGNLNFSELKKRYRKFRPCIAKQMGKKGEDGIDYRIEYVDENGNVIDDPIENRSQ